MMGGFISENETRVRGLLFGYENLPTFGLFSEHGNLSDWFTSTKGKY